MVLLVGVTYFFGIAQANGTIDRVIGVVLDSVGDSDIEVIARIDVLVKNEDLMDVVRVSFATCDSMFENLKEVQ